MAMEYEVSLKIDYAYTVPVAQSQAVLRVEPATVDGVQTISDTVLDLDPIPSERRRFTDFFGNRVTAVQWHYPLQEMKLALRFHARRFEARPGLLPSAPLSCLRAELAAYRSLSPTAPHHFTAASRRVPLDPEITAFARAALAPGMSAREAVRAIGAALNREMTFSSGATHVNTPASEAFRQRRGVCQDFAHIMIAGLRGVGIPAGYVSGFLRTIPPEGAQRLAGVDAMHAWLCAWGGGDVGWIAYDPTNDQIAGADYIAVGVGRDYDDLAPVRGALRGSGQQETAHRVDVIPQGA